jgi:hypothetical protein
MSFKIIGADDVSGSNSTANRFALTRFQCVASGTMAEFRVKSGTSGNVKYAIYADNSGEPGSLITAMNTGQAVVSGWNTLTFTSTPLVSGTYYWLAVCFDTTGALLYYATGGTYRYKSATYSSFTFPDPAGSGFTTASTYQIEAGWGDSVTAKASSDIGGGMEAVSLRETGAAETGSGVESSLPAAALLANDSGGGLDVGGLLQSIFCQDMGGGVDGVRILTGKAGQDVKLHPYRGRVNISHKEVNL